MDGWMDANDERQSIRLYEGEETPIRDMVLERRCVPVGGTPAPHCPSGRSPLQPAYAPVDAKLDADADHDGQARKAGVRALDDIYAAPLMMATTI